MQLKLTFANVFVGLLTLSSVAVTTALPIGFDNLQDEYAQYFRRQIRKPTDPPLCPQPSPSVKIWECPPRHEGDDDKDLGSSELPEGRAITTRQPLEDGINHWISREQPPKLSSRVDLDNAAQIHSRLDENLNALHDDKIQRAVDGKQAGQPGQWEERSTAEDSFPWIHPPPAPCGSGGGTYHCTHSRDLDGSEALSKRKFDRIPANRYSRAVEDEKHLE